MLVEFLEPHYLTYPVSSHHYGAADCIMAFMSDVQPYDMHNIHIETQPNKYIYRPTNKHITNKRELKANIVLRLRVGIVLYTPDIMPKWRVRLLSAL